MFVKYEIYERETVEIVRLLRVGTLGWFMLSESENKCLQKILIPKNMPTTILTCKSLTSFSLNLRESKLSLRSSKSVKKSQGNGKFSMVTRVKNFNASFLILVFLSS